MIVLLKIFIPFFVILQIIPVLIWLERKGSAYIQDRPGPNRAAILGVRLGGLLHSLADVLKLLFKEDITPNHVNRFYYTLAPMLALGIACVTFVVIPFADSIPLRDGFLNFQAADINAGVLYILAMTSLSVYGIMLAGWSSSNKFALLGGLRASAQMISYELSMGLAIVSVVMGTGSLSLNEMVRTQTANIFHWNFIYDPLACLIFIVAAFAETNRAPFDLPEGESELVAGYHVEYSSMKFAMFFMAEYANMIIASALTVVLFFGGWQIPFVPTENLRLHADTILYFACMGLGIFSLVIGFLFCLKFKKGKYGDKRDYEVLVLGIPGILIGVILSLGILLFGQIPFSPEAKLWIAAIFQILFFLTKVLMMCWVFIWVRWTLPRIRYDQLMNLGWKYMLPLAMANVVKTAIILF